MSIGAIARPFVANKIHDATQGHGSAKEIGVADDPVGHESPIAPSGYAQSRPIDPIILLQDRFNAIHYIYIILPAPFVFYPALEFLSITCRTARIGEEDSPAARRIDLKFVKPIDSIHTRRPTVNAQ